jgi:hypothetical protein
MDIVALSHLRWDFVFQRPQHLVTRAARRHRVLFVEEPILGDRLRMEVREVAPNVTVARLEMPRGLPATEQDATLAVELHHAVRAWRRSRLVAWHWSVMMEPASRLLAADVTVFDCMDELSLFHGAPPELVARESALLARADVVFTGGVSLWEAKRNRHANVHAFPSAVDLAHFVQGRYTQPEPAALRGIGAPRFIYAGVIDERINLGLIRRLAEAEIGEVVLVGPVAKIDEADVPHHPRIHRLGMQPYEHLPGLFAHSDVGLMPFAMNEATRFISPTKTPEYLAAGLPVVSTPVRDVVRTYGDLPCVLIAHDADAFVAACAAALEVDGPSAEVDRRLVGMSWEATWDAMERLIVEAVPDRDVAA